MPTTPGTYRKGDGKKRNPGGVKHMPVWIKDLCRDHTEEAIATIVDAMNSNRASWGVRVRAAEILLNRGWGMPEQSTKLTGPDGQPLIPEHIEITFKMPPHRINGTAKAIDGRNGHHPAET